MACLDNVIGIRSECTDVTPTVSTYIDDLVSTKEMEKFVDAPYETVKELFDNRVSMAVNEIKTSLYTAFTGNYITRSIIESKRIGQYDEHNAASAAIATTYKGIEVKMNQTKSSVKFVISSIKFYGNHTGNIDVKIFNTLTGELYATETIAAVAGEHVEAFVNYEYSGNLEPLFLGIMYDSSSVAAYKSTVNLSGCHSCGASEYYNINSFLQTRAINLDTGDAATQANITGKSDTGGLSIVYSVECDHENWMCNQKSILARPILYKTAELLMEYVLFQSERFNDHSTNFEKYKERQLMYKDKYDELMLSVVKNMILPKNDVCMRCERTNVMATSLP